MSFRFSLASLVVTLSCCSVACGVAPRSAAPGAVAGDAAYASGGARHAGVDAESSAPGAHERADAGVEREPDADNEVEFVPLSEPVPEHGVGRGVSVGASVQDETVREAAEVGAAREAGVAASEDR
jgi:hypothetical protein